VAPQAPTCKKCLDRFFAGERDQLTTQELAG